MAAEQPVLLVELERDLGAPADGWSRELGRRRIEICRDDLGRLAVPREVARAIYAEHFEAEARAARRRQELEERLVEADAVRRSQIPRGIPLDAVPVGVSPGEWLMRADPMTGPRRSSVLADMLDNPDGGLIYHPLNEGAS
jgi:hypothetical protein